MPRKQLSEDDQAKVNRLAIQMEEKLNAAGAVASARGFDSDEFLAAFAELEDVADQLRAIRGTHGKNWA